MNKRGNVILGLAIGIFIWIMGILTIPFIVDNIDVTRIGLNCTNTTISFGTKLMCLATDGIIPYVLWLLASLVLGLVVGGINR